MMLWFPGLAVADGSPEDSIRIDAERVILDGEWLTAEGPIRLSMGTNILEGEGLRYHTVSGLLEVRSGRWITEERTVVFEAAEIRVTEGTGRLLEASLSTGDFRIDSASLDVLEDSVVLARDVRFGPCQCETELWAIDADEVSLYGDDELVFRGGRFRVCEKTLVPIPRGRVPLQPRASGLLMPELYWRNGGAEVRTPLFFTLGPHADLLLSPEIHGQRGVRVRSEGRLGLPLAPLHLTGALGWDRTREDWRGFSEMRGGTSNGSWMAAVDSTWFGDPDYRADYEDDYLSRAEPWDTQRMVLGWGPIWLESEQSSADGAQLLAGALLGTRAHRWRAMAIDAGLRTDLVGQRLDGELESITVRSAGELAMMTGVELGPMRLDWQARSEGVVWQGSDPWLEVSTGGAAWLRTWGPLAGGTRLDRWGVIAAISASSGEDYGRHPWDSVAPSWQVGPAVHSRWVSSDGVPVSMGLEVPMTPDGVVPESWIRMQEGSWDARLRANLENQQAEVGWENGVWGTGGGVVRDSTVLQAYGWVDSPPLGSAAALNIGWSGLVDLGGRGSLYQGPYLRYASPCQCLDLRLSSSWSEDRTTPEFALQLELL